MRLTVPNVKIFDFWVALGPSTFAPELEDYWLYPLICLRPSPSNNVGPAAKHRLSRPRRPRQGGARTLLAVPPALLRFSPQ